MQRSRIDRSESLSIVNDKPSIGRKRRHMERVNAEITVTHHGERRVDLSPQGIRIGVLELSPWQVHPLIAASHASINGDAYLVKINYELNLDSDLHDGLWYEVAFTFDAADGAVAVMDAVPGATPAEHEQQAYLVDQYLQLSRVPVTTPKSIRLPFSDDVINVFGIGRSKVRWVHRAPRAGVLHPGSRAAWAIVLVPSGSTAVTVEFSARYRLPLGSALDFDRLDSSGSFTLELDEAGLESPIVPVPPSSTGFPVTEGSAPSHRIFISYAHDDDAHKLNALRFAHLLLDLGHDVHIDQLTDRRRRNWYDWVSEQILTADFVVVLASPRCKAVGEGEIGNDQHKGLRNELDLIRNLLHRDRDLWTMKLMPVILPGETVDHLPFWLLPEIVDHYVIEDFTPEALTDLLKAMDAAKPFLDGPGSP